MAPSSKSNSNSIASLSLNNNNNNDNTGPNSTYVYPDGSYEITDEELEEYGNVVNKSQGFDVPYFPNSYCVGMIMPMLTSELNKDESLLKCAEEAIKHYNNENDTNYEIIEIVKANSQAARGIKYYITFEVRQIGAPPDYPTTTFQARVVDGIPDIEVELCRPKPSDANSD